MSSKATSRQAHPRRRALAVRQVLALLSSLLVFVLAGCDSSAGPPREPDAGARDVEAKSTGGGRSDSGPSSDAGAGGHAGVSGESTTVSGAGGVSLPGSGDASLDAGASRQDAGADARVSDAAADSSTWGVIEPAVSYSGVSLVDWMVRWAEWAYAQTSCADPFFDGDGSLCGLYQEMDGPVFFFASSESDVSRTECRVPRGKAILLPLTSIQVDNAGVDPSDQLTRSQMVESVTDFVKSARDLVLTIDGVEITGLDKYAVGPSEYSYTLPAEPNWYSCNGYTGVNGTISPSFVGGVFVLVAPPPKGVHTIEYGGTATYDGSDTAVHIKSTFTVE